MKMFFLQKKILKLLFSIFLLFCAIPVFAAKSNHGIDGFVENKIDATKNARAHSSMGNLYFEEGKYIAALKEYEIAYKLSSKNQAAGAYLYNIARCYYVMGTYNFAKGAILDAIKKDCINMTYYNLLVDCFIKTGSTELELNKYIRDNENPYNRVIVGLIYLKTNRLAQARATFDDFIVNYPDLIITDDIQAIIRQL